MLRQYLIRYGVIIIMKKIIKPILAICLLMLTFTNSGAITIHVGEGSTATTTVLPIRTRGYYNYSQQIYTKAQINKAGMIHSISFHFEGGGATNSSLWDVYLGHTTKTNFSSNSDWVPVGNLTRVFSGAITLSAGNWTTVTLSTPFLYNNSDNLVVAVDENDSGRADTEGNFSAFTSGANTGLHLDRWLIDIDPGSPTTIFTSPTRTNLLSQVKFDIRIADPTNVTASAASTSQIDLAWLRNNAQDNVMIAYNTTNTFGTPTDGTSYSAGNAIPGGGTVIYNGSGTSFSHASLSANTSYYYKVWSAGTYDAQSVAYSPGVTGNAKTALVIANPTSVTATAISETQINLAWMRNSTPNNVMVAYSTTNSFGTPVFGTSYSTGNPIPGGGTVIYNGNGTSFNHTALTANTIYHYKLWSVGNDGVQPVAYSSGVTISAKTPVVIANPTSVTATAASAAQIDLAWMRNATPDNVMIAYSSTNSFGTPVPGTSYPAGNPITGGGTVIYNGNGTNFNHTPLNANTNYYYKLWSVGNYGAQPVAYSTGVTTSAQTQILNLPNPRYVAEWEQAEGAIVSYSGRFGLPNAMLKDISESGKLYVIRPSRNATACRNALTAAQVNMSNVVYITAALDSYWVRDYGPWTVFDGNNEMKIVDFTYNRPRTNDNNSTTALATALNLPRYMMNIRAAGGNIMTDGHGKAMSTNLILTENPTLSETDINLMFENYLGVTEYQKYADPFSGSSIDHIDLWAKLIDVDKVMIARVPSNHSDYTSIEAAVSAWQGKTSSYGTPYRIYRVDCGTGNSINPYINSYIFNKTIYLPQMSSSPSAADNAARAAYASAMPAYTIKGYYSTGIDAWLSSDAIHCRVNTKFDKDLIFVRHTPIQSAYPGSTVSISTDISSTLSVANDSTYVSYRYWDQTTAQYTNWMTVPLNPAFGNTWSVDIPTPASGDSLLYTIRATNSAGRTCDRSLNGRLDPFRIKLEGYHYRSVRDGNWDDPSTWEYSTDLITWATATQAPHSENSLSITVRDPDTVTLGSSVNADQMTIESGGTIIVAAETTLTLDNGPGTDLTINGKLTITGSLVFAPGASSTGANSTIEFNGTIPQVAGSGFPAEIMNLIINNPSGVSITEGTIVTGTLTQTSGEIANISEIDGYCSATKNHLSFPGTGNKISGWSIAMTGAALYPQRIDRKWDISGAYTGTKSVTFYWTEDDDHGYDWVAMGKVPTVYCGNTALPASTVYSVSEPIRTVTVEIAAQLTKGSYTIGAANNDTLPVELSYFRAQVFQGTSIMLQWKTQSETNVSGFQIYRHTEEDLASAIMKDAFIPATNTSQTQYYVYYDREIYDIGSYYYWLESVDFDGSNKFYGPIPVHFEGLQPGIPSIPAITCIAKNFPNPFNPHTRLVYGMEKDGELSIDIYNVRGQKVRSLLQANAKTGWHTVDWDGTNDLGQQLGSGVYYFRMLTQGKTLLHRATLLK